MTSTKDSHADIRSSAEPDISDERRVRKVDRRETGGDRRDARRVDFERSPRREKPERRRP